VTVADTLPHLLTIDQLVQRLGTSTRRVRRLIAERRIPYLKVGKLVRFDPGQINRWLDTPESLSGHPKRGLLVPGFARFTGAEHQAASPFAALTTWSRPEQGPTS
jgi:excisionase family DNA binding protein